MRLQAPVAIIQTMEGIYRTYTNAVFVNKTILVPTYRPSVDNPALDQWRDLMPGYNIVGIDVDNQGENLISSLGCYSLYHPFYWC